MDKKRATSPSAEAKRLLLGQMRPIQKRSKKDIAAYARKHQKRLGIKREAIAWHEAAHALMAVLLEIPIVEVSIKPGEAWFGRMQQNESVLQGFVLEDNLDPRMFERIEEQILIAVAGSLIELDTFPTAKDIRKDPPSDYSQAFIVSDVDSAHQPTINWNEGEVTFMLELTTAFLDGDKNATSAMFRYLIRKAYTILIHDPHYFALQNIVDFLLKHGKASGEQVRDIVLQSKAAIVNAR